MKVAADSSRSRDCSSMSFVAAAPCGTFSGTARRPHPVARCMEVSVARRATRAPRILLALIGLVLCTAFWFAPATTADALGQTVASLLGSPSAASSTGVWRWSDGTLATSASIWSGSATSSPEAQAVGTVVTGTTNEAPARDAAGLAASDVHQSLSLTVPAHTVPTTEPPTTEPPTGPPTTRPIRTTTRGASDGTPSQSGARAGGQTSRGALPRTGIDGVTGRVLLLGLTLILAGWLLTTVARPLESRSRRGRAGLVTFRWTWGDPSPGCGDGGRW